MMKKLPINIDEIAEAMDMTFDESAYYLDLETGRLLLISSELFDEDEDSPWFSDGEKELLAIAREIDAGSDRYALVPDVDPSEGFEHMERFARTVTDPKLSEHLEIALDGRGAFRRFRNVLANHPEERERWFAFKNERMAERAREWLSEIGVEPVEGASPPA
jgi:hypothetical protein